MTIRLSFPQAAALKAIQWGDRRPNFPKSVLDALVRHGYIRETETGYEPTDKGQMF